MIIKIYRPDGTPDLNRWLVSCDICDTTTPLIGSGHWLVPDHPDMPISCPACVNEQAAHLVYRAITCPGCGLGRVDFWTDPLSGFHICCWHCGAFLLREDDPNTGSRWFIP
jgi:hypothetical protein